MAGAIWIEDWLTGWGPYATDPFTSTPGVAKAVPAHFVPARIPTKSKIFFGERNIIPRALLTDAGGTYQLRQVCRAQITSQQISVTFPGWYTDTAGTGDTVVPNNYTIDNAYLVTDVTSPWTTVPWTGTTAKTATNTTGPLSVDITGATVGEWVYCFVSGKRDQSSYTFTGWTQVGSSFNQTATQGFALFRRKKIIGDTTFPLSVGNSTFFEASPFSYPGLDPTNPDAVAAGTQSGSTWGQINTGANNVMTTPAVTPSGAGQVALALFGGQGSVSAQKVLTWTPGAGLTDRLQDGNANASLAWESFEITDSAGTVTVASHSYSSTCANTGTTNNGFGGLLYLIPAPTKTINRIQFAGSNAGTCTAGTDLVGVTTASLTINPGDTYWIRAYVHPTAGGSYPVLDSGTAFYPDELCTPGSDVTSNTNADFTTFLTTFRNQFFGPLLVEAVPALTHESVAIIGDSIAEGVGDDFSTITDQGFIVRALTGHRAYQKFTLAGESALQWLTSPGIRRRSYAGTRADYAICEYPINDLQGAANLATAQARLVTIWASLIQANQLIKTYQTTITPKSASTDGWTTTGSNQTTDATVDPVRVPLNNWIRAGAPIDPSTHVAVAVGTGGALLAGQTGHPLFGYFEIADLAESARDSGKWKALYTADGIHPTPTGYAAMASGIDLSQLSSSAATVTGTAALVGAGALSVTGLDVELGAAVMAAAGAMVTAGVVTELGVAVMAAASAMSTSAFVQEQASAAFVAAGSLTAAGSVTDLGVAALAGAGALTVAASVTEFASATLAGAGALTTAGLAQQQAAAALSAAGTLTTVGLDTELGVAAFTGAGALSTTGTRAVVGTAAFVGAGTLTTIPSITVLATGAFAGAGALSTAASVTELATAALAGAGALTTAASVTEFAAAALAGAGALSTSALVTELAAAALNGAGVLTTAGTVAGNVSATLTGAGALTSAASVTELAAAALNGAGVLTTAGIRSVLGVAALTGAGVLTSAGVVSKLGVVALTGAGVLSVTGLDTELGLAAMAGAGALSTTAVVSRIATATLSGAGVLTSAGSVTELAAAALNGAGTLTTAGIRAVVGTAALTGAGALSATGGTLILGTAALAGAGSLSTTGLSTQFAATSLDGAGTLTTAGSTALAQLVGVGSLSPDGFASTTAAAVLAGAGVLSPSGMTSTTGTATLIGASTLVTAALRYTYPQAAFAGAGSLTSAAIPARIAAAALAGAGVLSPVGLAQQLGGAVLVASSALSTVPLTQQLGAVAFSAVTTMVASAFATARATAALGGVGVLTTASSVTELPAAPLVASAVFTVTSTVTELGVATLVASAKLHPTVLVTTTGTQTFTATTTLTVAAVLSRQGVVTFVAVTTMTAAGLKGPSGAVILQGAGALSTTAGVTRIIPRTSVMLETGRLMTPWRIREMTETGRSMSPV